jgi:hypothetical protein
MDKTIATPMTLPGFMMKRSREAGIVIIPGINQYNSACASFGPGKYSSAAIAMKTAYPMANDVEKLYR